MKCSLRGSKTAGDQSLRSENVAQPLFPMLLVSLATFCHFLSWTSNLNFWQPGIPSSYGLWWCIVPLWKVLNTASWFWLCSTYLMAYKARVKKSEEVLINFDLIFWIEYYPKFNKFHITDLFEGNSTKLIG